MSVVKPKRAMHPNSLANLRPPWQPGEVTNHNGARGPYIKPLLQRYADVPLAEVRRLATDDSLPVAAAVAIQWLLDALDRGTRTTGAISREQVADRLDGPVGKGDIPSVAVQVNLTFQDGTEA